MKKSLFLIYMVLLILTITTSLVANSSVFHESVIALIMALAAFKFILVAFQFMELRKAHSFWKISLLLTLGLFMILIIVIK